MKRAIKLAILVLVIFSAIIASLPLLVSSESVRTRILAHLGDLTGREVTFRGEPEVSISPFLGIEISELVVPDPLAGPDNTALLTVERVRGQLNILPLLVGNIEISQYQLLRPVLSLRVYGDGQANWKFEQGILHQQLQTAADDSVSFQQSARFGKFELSDGTLEYENEISGAIEKITNIEGMFDWPDTASPTLFMGKGVWRGEQVETTVAIEEPLQLYSNQNSQVEFSVVSSPLTSTFSGAANLISDLFVSGDVDVKSPSVSRLSQLLGLELGYFKLLGELSAQGKLEATVNDFKLVDAAINLSGNEATGVLHVNRDELGTSKIGGTLAFENIDLGTYLLDASKDNEAAEIQIDKDTKVDLRISADALQFSNLSLTDVGAAIYINDGNWSFEIGDSQGLGGNLLARLGERTENEKRHRYVSASGRNLDTARLSQLFPESVIGATGLADIDIDLRAPTDRNFSFTREMNGEVSMRLLDGSLTGFDLVTQLDSVDLESNTAHPIDGAGATAFSSAEAKFFLSKGIGAVSKGLIDASQRKFQFIGNVDFHNGQLALRGQEVLDTGLGARRLIVGGTVASPLVAYELKPQPAPSPKPEQQDGEAEAGNDG